MTGSVRVPPRASSNQPEADALPDRRLKLTAIPRDRWRRFFPAVVLA
jgi:hypothetical protein